MHENKLYNTLYITDLDGTLLNNDAVLSPQTIALLTPLVRQGLQLTVATARSPATAVQLLRPLALTLPVVLMTGAMVYDLQAARTLSTRSFSPAVSARLCAVLEQDDREALAYAVRDGALYVYYKEFRSELEQQFVTTRLHTPYKTFVPCTQYAEALAGSESLMFLLCLETLSEAEHYHAAFTQAADVTCHFYPYEYGGGYLLEVYPAGCDKAGGLAFVRRHTAARRVVCFGDNVNDLPLFAACDEAYAVENACVQLKQAATQVIAANTAEGVARWIAQDVQRQR